jgi:oxygen-independent coproporphyrinogen-3 oxidase
VGVQGLDHQRLAFLGRWHAPDEALRAVAAALAALPRVSADLIYGVAAHEPAHAQRPEEAAREVATVADMGVGHLSAYALTIEDETKFGTLHRQGRLPLLGDDIVAESFVAVGEALSARGFRRYEVSNFAQPGEESRHNAAYWRGDDYLGLGCAAFGTLSRPDGTARRYRNPLTPRRYYAAVDDGSFAPSYTEELRPETRLQERLMLGMRMIEGVDLARAQRELGVEVWTPERRARADRLVEAGRLEERDGRLRIPPSAWLYADGIAAELF